MPPAEELYKQVQQLTVEQEHAREENAQLKTENEMLRGTIGILEQKLYGRGKSEKLNDAQLRLQLEALKEAAEKEEQEKREKIEYERRKARTDREIPAERFKDLPVEETIIIDPDEVKAEPEAFEQIGEEETFEVDIHPPKLFKRRIVRPKYRKKGERERPPLLAPAPKRPIEGGYASAGLLAWITLSKYVEHQPLYRLEKASKRWGAQLSRQSMSDWVEQVALWLKPIYDYMRKDLLAGSYVQADETPIEYQDPDIKKGKTSQGWLWGISHPKSYTVYDWRLSRRHGEACKLLGDYEGLLQSDAYEAYASYAENRKVIRIGCWAHARRKFHEALRSAPDAAAEVLEAIGELYEKEADYREEKLGYEERGQRRKDEQQKLLEDVYELVKKHAVWALPQSPLGKACNYTLNQWEPLKAYLEHGEVEIDNNSMENAIRPTAVGKKNYLFIGSPEAGMKSAIIYSVVITCQRHGVDPLAYLKDVLTRLPSMTNQDDYGALTPTGWAKAHQWEPPVITNGGS